MNGKKLLILLAMAFAFLPGCDMGQRRLTVQFASTEGLRVDDPVLFEQNRIGAVREVRYTAEGQYLVDIAVERAFTNALTVDSRFFIGEHPGQPGRRALLVEQSQAGGALLPDKALVRGAVKPPAWRQAVETLRRKAGDWEAELSRSIDELKEDYQEPATDVERDLDAALKEMTRTLRQLREAVRQSAESEEVRELRQAAEELLVELQQRLAEWEGSRQKKADDPSAAR